MTKCLGCGQPINLKEEINDRIAELEKYEDDYCFECGHDTNKEVLKELRKLLGPPNDN